MPMVKGKAMSYSYGKTGMPMEKKTTKKSTTKKMVVPKKMGKKK